MTKWIIIILALLIISVFVFLIVPLFKEMDFHKPTGKNKVGTNHFEIYDNKRERRISVRVFYPAIAESGSEYLPVMDPNVGKAFGKMYHIPGGGGKSSPSNSLIDGRIVEGMYPVIIFSHGAFSYDTQNLSTLEDLASNGYIVYTLSHTDEALLTIFPGYELAPAPDTSFIENSMKMSKEAVIEYKEQIEILTGLSPGAEKLKAHKHLGVNFYNGLKPYLEQRLTDIHFLLGSLKGLQADSTFPVAGKMDLDRIGMFGHSFGGITTSYICSEEDSPVKAGINMDAPVIIYDDDIPRLKRPFAFFYSTETSLIKEGTINLTGCNSFFEEDSSNPVFSLSFEGTAHYNFSDFNFMPPFFRYTPMLGSIDGMKMSKILNRSVLEFFDYTLKKDDESFYAAGDSPYEEVTIKLK
ncbi:MAG: hypothetical protein JEZ04_13785 [Spirochaetales bacterium]|nr:hypothetical protein [Spirochaetales bacterium]